MMHHSETKDEEMIVNVLAVFFTLSIIGLYLFATPEGEEIFFFLREYIW